MEQQQEHYTMPLIGDKAPDFEALTTTGKMKFSDYEPGKWKVLFSHPADFTPGAIQALLFPPFFRPYLKRLPILLGFLSCPSIAFQNHR